jgi:hypothetical protein
VVRLGRIVLLDFNGKGWHRDLGKQSHIWATARRRLFIATLPLNFGPGERSF